jgi:hypothetical protein
MSSLSRARAAHYNDICVGTVCSTLQPGPAGTKKLYIMALAVLAAYRGHGVGECFAGVAGGPIVDPCPQGIFL